MYSVATKESYDPVRRSVHLSYSMKCVMSEAEMTIPFPLPLDVRLSRQVEKVRDEKVSVSVDKQSPPSMNIPPPYPPATHDVKEREMSEIYT